MIVRTLSPLLLAAACLGCLPHVTFPVLKESTTGRRVDPEVFEKAKEGVTTQVQLIEMLGTPSSRTSTTSVLYGSQTTCTYTYCHREVSGAIQVEMTAFYFQGGVLQRKTTVRNDYPSMR